MPSPLFPNMNRAQREARKAFAKTDIGQAVGMAANVRTSGRVAVHAAKSLSVGKIAKYGKEQALKALLRELGPVGSLISTLLRPGGEEKRVGKVQQELDAAKALLEAFGHEVSDGPGSPPPGTGGPGSGGGAPPAAPPAGPPGPDEPDDNRIPVDLGNGSKIRVPSSDPIVSGEMIDVRSSNVHSIGYLYNPVQPNQSVLQVRYLQSSERGRKSGPGPLYYYYNVPGWLFRSFERAASKGEWVWDRLRVRGTVSGHQFPYELKGITGDYVPRRARRVGDTEWFLGRTLGVQRGGRTVGLQSTLPDMPVATRPGRAEAGRPGRGS